jgi:type IV pilus assembly protein PilZ
VAANLAISAVFMEKGRGTERIRGCRPTQQERRRMSGNNRSAERLQHELLVAYRTMDGFITDWALNISQGGMFINSRNPLPVGSVVRLIISLPGIAFPFDLSGRVKRVSGVNDPHEAPGMAVEFIDIDPEMRSQIDEFVEKLRRELAPERKKKEPLPKP